MNSYAQQNQTIGHQFLALVFALIYAGTFTYLPLDVFTDRVNYFKYATNSWIILERYWAIGPLATLFNEPLWLLINAGLASLFPTEVVLRLIIFVPAMLVAWNLLRQSSYPFVWLLFFLLLPQIISHHTVHLRQGFAVAVFLTGWFMDKRSLRWFMFFIAPLIHASFFFILVLLVLTNVTHRLRFSASLRTLIFVLYGIVIGVGLGVIASFLSARQASYYSFSMTSVSGLGAIFWLMILVLMWAQGRVFIRRYTFESGAIVFYLITYFLIEVSVRIFESVVVLVLLAGLRLTGWRRISFFVLISNYAILQYIFRLNEPWLGFGPH